MHCWTYDWECAALSLLADSGTDADEVFHAGWGRWSYKSYDLAEGPRCCHIV
jgi:hypothetical protein